MPSWNAEFLTSEEVRGLGLGAVGEGVLIHRTAVLVRCERIFIGHDVRIDPFVLISVGSRIRIGDHVHIAAHASVIGAAEVELSDFVGISQGARVLSSTDDFSGAHLTGPTIPDRYKAVHSDPVRLGRHVVIGAGAIVLPGCDIGDGTTVGALSLIKRSLEPWKIYAGSPARILRDRSRDLLAMEAELLAEEQGPPAAD